MRKNKIRTIIFRTRDFLLPRTTGEECWAYLSELFQSGRPFMAAKLGAVEIKALLYARGPLPALFLKRYVELHMHQNAGFFPVTRDSIKRFADLLMTDIRQIDVLFSWRPEEIFFKKQLAQAFKAGLYDSGPHPESDAFWTKYLAGKKVLVIHPLAETIESQYHTRRTKLFSRPDFIPEFHSLSTVKAVQTIAGNTAGFESWFDALEHMEREIDTKDFDVALIGCGAYGLPLAAYIKRMGKQAIHLGGVLQLYFGIKGKRWDNSGLYNEYWVSPEAKEIPRGAERVEDGCYW